MDSTEERTLTDAERKEADETLQWLEDNKDTGCGLLMDPEDSEKLSLRRIELGQYLGEEETMPDDVFGGTLTFRRWFNADRTPAI